MIEHTNANMCPIPLPPRTALPGVITRVSSVITLYRYPSINMLQMLQHILPENFGLILLLYLNSKIVLVMDLKATKYVKIRELACNDVQKVADSLNVNLTHLNFDRLNFGETNAFDVFYNADVALVDVSIQKRKS
uniref:DRHyd-ASK domain-containing protein n=2 Tax=Loa loa TaxID=7209 RepID=A0A1I7VF63_LOALO